MKKSYLPDVKNMFISGNKCRNCVYVILNGTASKENLTGAEIYP